MEGHGVRRATAEQEQDRAVETFQHEIGGDPPGERSLVPQILGWSYILTGFGLGLVTIRETAAAGTVTWPVLLRGLAVAVYVAVGVAVDADKDWAIWPALATSVVTLAVLGPAALDARPLPALACLVHATLLLAVPIDRLLRDRPED